MTKETTTSTPATGTNNEPGNPKDPQVEELEKQAARVVARQKLADAQLGALAALATGVKDGPSNTVTFGAKSGALAPWLAQSVLANIAAGIAKGAWEAFYPTLPEGQALLPSGGHVVFVTDDPELLASDVVSRQVQTAIRGRTNEAAAAVGNLTAAAAALETAVARYKDEEAKRERRRRSPAGGGTRKLLKSLLVEAEGAAGTAAAEAAAAQAAGVAAAAEAAPAETAETAGAPAAAEGGGPIAAAVDLVRLLAVDYTVTAAEVTFDSALLARQSAGQLANTSKTGDLVLLDGFALANNSSTLRTHNSLITALNEVADNAQDLARAVAPVIAEAEEYHLAVDDVTKAWTEATTTEDAADGAADDLKEALEELTERLTVRRAAAAPAEDLIEYCDAFIAAARVELSALAIPDAAGLTPLQRACSRDRLHDKTPNATTPVTHILLVEATHAGADIVTRSSILGASGRVGYIGGANGSWVMVDTNGVVFGGGAVEGASHMTHDIATGESKRNLIEPTSGAWTSTDPLERNEQWIRLGVVILALALALIGVAATLSVIF